MAITRYKGLVVGVGAIGALLESELKRPKPATHAGALKKHKQTDLVALVDTDIDILTQASKLFPKARTYTSLDEALAVEKPDIVCIATPAKTHIEILQKAIISGVKMIVCEKPIASSHGEAQAVAELLSRSSVTFVLNYQRRYFSLFKEAREAIVQGKLGAIQHVTSYYSNGLYNNGGHALDVIDFLLQDTIVSSQGFVGRGVHPSGDVQVHAHLVTKKGTTIQLIALDQEAYGIHDIQLFGTNGAYFFSDYGYTRTFVPAGPSLFSRVHQLLAKLAKRKEKKESMVQGALADAIQAYEKGIEPVSGIANGVSCMKALDDITDSVQM